MDPTAQRIGAANTLIRQPDGSLDAHNTDWSAAIAAIEAGLASRARQHTGEQWRGHAQFGHCVHASQDRHYCPTKLQVAALWLA